MLERDTWGNGVIPVLVIGAGPHALAFVAKFLDSCIDPFEESPWNDRLFKYNTSKQRVTYRFPAYSKQLQGERDQVIRQKIRDAEVKGFAPEESIRIVDPHGEWLKQWKYQFEQLDIPYLRSSINAHVDPVSWETLRMSITKECKEQDLPPCRELQFVPRTDYYHGPFAAPSSKQFISFCKQVIHRYNLQSIIEKASAECITKEENNNNQIYCVRLSTGKTIRAEHVVLALGPQRESNWPDAFVDFRESRSSLPLLHSLELLSPHSVSWTNILALKPNSPTNRILVIGGGSTSGHIVLALEKQYAAQDRTNQLLLTLVSRQALRVQAFDIELSWMGRTRGQKLATFWSEKDFERRARTLKTAKNGGASISAEIYHQLLQLQQDCRLKIREWTEVVLAEFETQHQHWRVEFQDTSMETHDNEYYYDYIICATGTTSNLAHEPLLSNFRNKINLTSTNHAKLSPELRLTSDENIFILGEAAALQLGPGAVNLMGARAGAARVSRAIKQSLKST